MEGYSDDALEGHSPAPIFPEIFHKVHILESKEDQDTRMLIFLIHQLLELLLSLLFLKLETVLF